MPWPLSGEGSEPQGGRQWVALTNTRKLLLNFSLKNGWFILRLVRASPPCPGGYQPRHCLLAKQTSCTGQCRGAHTCATALSALCPGQGAPCCGWRGCPCTWSGSSCAHRGFSRCSLPSSTLRLCWTLSGKALNRHLGRQSIICVSCLCSY